MTFHEKKTIFQPLKNGTRLALVSRVFALHGADINFQRAKAETKSSVV